MDDIGEYLRLRRIAAGLTQKQVSNALNYGSAQFVSNWERGKCVPPIDAVRSLVPLLSLSKGIIIELYSLRTQRKLEKAFKLKRRSPVYYGGSPYPDWRL